MLMRLVLTGIVIVTILSVVPATVRATPDACGPDNKLIGRIELSTSNSPDSWWGLTRQGLADAGITDYLGFLNSLLSTSFTTESEVANFLVNIARGWDANGNNYVCASHVRGTRAWLGDPTYSFYTFGISDDKHADD